MLGSILSLRLRTIFTNVALCEFEQARKGRVPMHAPKVQADKPFLLRIETSCGDIESLVRLVDACLKLDLWKTLKSLWHRGVCPRARSAHEQKC